MTPAIDNDSEFYPHHYLAEVLDSDLAGVRGRWAEAGAASPPQRLAALARDFARLRASAENAPPSADDIAAFHAQVVEALGYQRVPQTLALPDRPAEAPGLPTLAQIVLPGRVAPWVIVLGDGFTLKAADIFALPALPGDESPLTWEAASHEINQRDSGLVVLGTTG